jgi:hypothetical protein
MMSRPIALTVAAIACCVAQRAAGGSIYGCANNRTGRIRSIALASPRCGASETLVSWDQVGPQGPPGQPGPSGPPGPAIVVKDSNGSEIGLAAPPDSVLMRVNGALVSVATAVSGFQGAVQPDAFVLYYGAADCSAQPLQYGPPSDSLFPPPVLIFQGILYYSIGSVATCANAIKDFPGVSDYCAQHQGTVTPDGGCCRPVGPCCPGTTASLDCPSNSGLVPPWLGLGTFDLTRFVPPFHTEGP